MKRRELEKHLRSHDCRLHHHGGRHDMWINAATGVQATLPRHQEVKKATARAICSQLGVPVPTGA